MKKPLISPSMPRKSHQYRLRQSEGVESMTTKFRCPHCDEELNVIENRASAYLIWNEGLGAYHWCDTSCDGQWLCNVCGERIDISLLEEIINDAIV
jgi:transcription elongation factor Elf1